MAKARPIPGLDPERPLFVNAGLMIEGRLAEMLDWEPHLASPNHAWELHQMRIAAKRVRYTMEIFEDSFAHFTPHGSAFSAAIEEVKKLQEHLGVIHDADALVPLLNARWASLLSAGHADGKRGLEELSLGVHHVDYGACSGLLATCEALRDKRDRRWERLQADWQRLRDEDFFGGLRSILRTASSAAPSAGADGVRP